VPNDYSRFRILSLTDGYCRLVKVPWGTFASGGAGILLIAVLVGSFAGGPKEPREPIPTYDHDEVMEYPFAEKQRDLARNSSKTFL
jgi:hypothetical protein